MQLLSCCPAQRVHSDIHRRISLLTSSSGAKSYLTLIGAGWGFNVPPRQRTQSHGNHVPGGQEWLRSDRLEDVARSTLAQAVHKEVAAEVADQPFVDGLTPQQITPPPTLLTITNQLSMIRIESHNFRICSWLNHHYQRVYPLQPINNQSIINHQ